MMHRTHLQLHGTRCIVTEHVDKKRGNPLLPLHRLFFSIIRKLFLYAPSYIQGSTYHSLYTSLGVKAGKGNQKE